MGQKRVSETLDSTKSEVPEVPYPTREASCHKSTITRHTTTAMRSMRNNGRLCWNLGPCEKAHSGHGSKETLGCLHGATKCKWFSDVTPVRLGNGAEAVEVVRVRRDCNPSLFLSRSPRPFHGSQPTQPQPHPDQPQPYPNPLPAKPHTTALLTTHFDPSSQQHTPANPTASETTPLQSNLNTHTRHHRPHDPPTNPCRPLVCPRAPSQTSPSPDIGFPTATTHKPSPAPAPPSLPAQTRICTSELEQ